MPFVAQQGATKWIIDLRDNSGGNCWPMLAGTGPLLGNGVCGYFVRDNKTTTIRYENGAAMHGSQILCKATNPVQLTDRQRGSIVVLPDPLHTTDDPAKNAAIMWLQSL